MGTRFTLSACVAMSAVLLGLVVSGPVAAEETLERLQKAGIAHIGVAAEPPSAIIDPASRLTGADPDIAREVFKNLGVADIKANVVDFGALIPSLAAGGFDTVATGLFERPERRRAVAFSQPLLCTREGFLVKKGNPLGLHSYADLAKTGAKLSALGGGAEEKRAISLGVSRDSILSASDIFNAVELLKSGRVDVLGFPDLSLRAALQRIGGDDYELVSDLADEPIQCAAAAFKKSDTALRDKFDAEVSRMKDSGKLDEILTKYSFDPKLTATPNRDALCKAN